jgi:cobalamin synthase
MASFESAGVSKRIECPRSPRTEYFFGAVRFFTRLPVPAWVGHSQEALDHSARYFPLVGIMVGVIGATGLRAHGLRPAEDAGRAVVMAATLLVTGAFHEDGWPTWSTASAAAGRKRRCWRS